MTENRAREIEERLKALQEITIELLSPRPLNETLTVIVEKAADLLVCDAGTIYVRECDDLFFEVAINRSIRKDFSRARVTKGGLAHYCFETGASLRVEDVGRIPASAPYRFDPTYDQKLGYATKSVLVQPLRNPAGQVIGVIQLINRKNERAESWPVGNAEALANMPSFSEEDADLLTSFGAIASGVVENARLQQEIKDVFEGFVTASVQAIESRDPVTRGHSERVAYLTVELAQKVDRAEEPKLAAVNFSNAQISEIRYAALLHDFGKIGVREATLQKEEKLSPLQKERIRARLQEFRWSAEIRSLRDYLGELMRDRRPPSEIEIAHLEKHIRTFGGELEDIWTAILDLNRPTVLDDDRTARLEKLAHMHCPDCQGHSTPLLEPADVFALKIKRGSLTDAERLEIESHVTHTYEFLRKIPWSKDLAKVPEIAFGHHERVDGKGYPRQLGPAGVPVQSRIMAVCDVYDALVASDRPYKPSLPSEKALEILTMQSVSGQLDPALVRVFIESRCYAHADFTKLLEPATGPRELFVKKKIA